MLEKPGRKIAVGEFYEQYEVSVDIATKLQDAGVEVSCLLPHRAFPRIFFVLIDDFSVVSDAVESR